ncbi:hypothetical protein [Mycolicibacterium fortuitum]|uniref:hypothetical protein n=1 Tax=Mycolicibacterium fortuitum TaxID=1766 RepID=UPI00096BF1C8|nr:hypothetical protein [Mycolicibacterium fortuitum]OMC02164.1 hypothetical protein A5734_14965 [Mycolicibacterium fortuitum]
MKSGAPLLVEPAYANFPEYSETLGPEVADLCHLAGFPPDPEQELGLNALFGIDSNGRSTAFEFTVIAARQNLKTGFEKQAALGWLFITEQRLISWSAHDMTPTLEALNDLTYLIENTPSLAKRLEEGPTNGVFRGSGSMAIALKPSKACPDGQRVLFKARTKSGGRGLTGNKVILDEGFALRKAHMGSLMPTLSAVPDPQLLVGSSACLPESEVLRKLIERGRSVDPSPRKRLGHLEFCAPEDSCEDPECPHYVGYPGCAMDKREFIIMANPQAGRRITWEYLEGERDSLDPSEFGRERLGWHDKPEVEDGPLISKEGWATKTDAQSVPGQRLAFGVYVNKLQTAAAIGIAGYREDGKIHVGIVPAERGGHLASRPGISWIPARMKELKDAWSPCGWGLDDRSAAGSLLPDLKKLGFETADETVPESSGINNATASDVARACGTFYSKFNDDQLRHLGSKPLADSVTAGKMRDLADAWAWDRKDNKSDIVQLMAVTLAVHALETAPAAVEVWEPLWT